MPLYGDIARNLRSRADFSGPNGEYDHHGGAMTRAGVTVDEWDATKIIAASGAVGFIADSAGALPLRMVERGDPNRRAVEPPEFRSLWSTRVNWHTDSTAAWISMYLGLTITGNAFAQLGWDGDTLAAIYPLNPSRVSLAWARDDPAALVLTAFLDAGGRVEMRNTPGERAEFLHVVDRRRPGEILGMSRVRLHREELGLARALTQSFSGHLGRGMSIAGIATIKGLGETAQEKLEQKMRQEFTGPGNAGRVMIASADGVTFQRVQWSPADIEYLATTKQKMEEILTIWQTPPLALGMTREPSSWGTGLSEIRKSIEAFTIKPWADKVQAAINAHILEGTPYGVVYDYDALQAASPKERAERDEIRLRSGQTSIERVLERNNEAPFEPDETVYSPLNWGRPEDREARRLRDITMAAAALARAGRDDLANQVAQAGLDGYG